MSFKIKFCFLGLFALLFSACGNDASKHHMALNEANGFDSIYDTNASTLKITSAADPQGQKKLILYFFSSALLFIILVTEKIPNKKFSL